jgi:multicomponent K+:H+ antiporter subunit G
VSHAAALSPLIIVVVSLLVLLGALLAFIGSIGLLRLSSFYDRVHPPTMGTTLGVGCTLIGSMVLFSALESRPVLHEVVITVFMIVTTPVTYMLLVRAALHRDRAEGKDPESGRAVRHGLSDTQRETNDGQQRP